MIKQIKYKRSVHKCVVQFNNMKLYTQTSINQNIETTKIYYTIPKISLLDSVMVMVDEQNKEIHLYSNNLQNNDIGNYLTIGEISNIIGEKHGGGEFKLFVV